MKVYGYIWTLALLAAVITGCRDVDDRLDKIVSDHVEFTETEVVLPSVGRTESIVVTSDLTWNIEGDAPWCTVSPASGPAGTSTIYFTSVPNTEYTDRSVNFTLVAGEKRTVLTVYQKKKDEIVFDKDKFDNIPMEGAEIEVAMSTNVAYTIDLPGGGDEWIEHLPAGRAGTRALERKTERFRISPTDEWDERAGLIIFIREDERTRDTVKVFQVQRDKILLTPSVIRPVIEGQKITVELRSNIDYEITIPNEYTGWLSYESVRADVIDVKAAATDAPRYGEIIIRDRNNPSLEAKLEVYQVEEDMVLFEEASVEVEATGGTVGLDVLDNIDGDYELIIPKYVTWIKLAPVTRALTSSTVKIVVAENPEGMIARSAKLILRGTNGRDIVSKPIQVTQKGRAPMTDDLKILEQVQQLMGLVHNNWPGGPSTTTYTPCVLNSSKDKVVTLNMPALTGTLGGKYTKTTELPEVVGDLKNLTTVTIAGHITGNIPVSIGSLPNLTTLTINNRTGTSPGVNGLPPELGGLESLRTLTISQDFSDKGLDLATMLDFIGELTNLRSLSISNCNYGDKMPESWRNLTNLESLTLSGTGFVDLGPISDMVSLKTLNIQNDAIEDLPDLSMLTQLNSVTLSNNPELKQIPASLMSVGSLTSLTIANNRLESLPEDWSALPNMLTLNLSNTSSTEYRIKGTLPPSMGNMTKLTSLNLSNNELEGQIPAEFGNLKELSGYSGFNIQGNKFTSIASGVLPSFKKITTLNLSNNAFAELPEDIVKMTWLTSLTATNNEFTGELPANIGDLENLTTLNLSRDPNPSTPFQSPGLGGFIPASITNLKKLTVLNLSGNNFIGPIPANIGDMTALNQLILNDNNLSGEIPLSLMKLPSTSSKQIFLQNNNLTGYIPDAFRNMYYLWKLDLRNNNLQGSVPSGLTQGDRAFNTNSAILHLSGNRLTGPIPQELREKLKITYTVPWQIFEQQPGYGLTME